MKELQNCVKENGISKGKVIKTCFTFAKFDSCKPVMKTRRRSKKDFFSTTHAVALLEILQGGEAWI